MKHREIVRPILGDLIMALTDKIFKFVPQRLQAYPCDTSMPAGFSVYGGASSTGEAACPRRSSARPGMLVLSQPRLLERAQLNGLFKGGEPPLWSRAGFKPRSRIQWIANVVARYACLVAALALTACTSTFEPRVSAGSLEQPRLPTAKEVRGGVGIAIEEYFSSHKSRRAFDADLGAQGVLPFLVHLDNKSPLDYRIERAEIRGTLNGLPLANLYGIEAAETGAIRSPVWNALVNTAAIGPFAIYFWPASMAGSASQTQKINRQIEQHFERVELTDRIVKTNETATGFVFFRMPAGVSSLDTTILEMTLDAEPVEGHPTRQLAYRFIIPAR